MRTYYVYFDLATKLYFYYDAESGATTWTYPQDGHVYEPNTLRPVYPPGSAQRSAPRTYDEPDYTFTQRKPQATVAPAPSAPPQMPRKSSAAEAQESPESSTDGGKGTSKRAQQVGVAFRKFITSFSRGRTFLQFAETAFAKAGKVAANELVQYVSEPSPEPLLESTNSAGKDAVKGVKKLNKMILKYARAPFKDTKEVACFPKIYETLEQTPALIDEAYAQVMKIVYTMKAPEVVTYRAFQVLLLLSTFFFPSSDFLGEAILTFLAQGMTIKHKQIGPLYVFCFIRFEATFHAHAVTCSFQNRNEQALLEIPKHAESSSLMFGVSLWEISWFQARVYSDLLVPRIEVLMTEKMFELGAEQTEGVFRTKDDQNLGQLMGLAESGKDDFLEGASLGDVTALFMEWYKDIPGGVLGDADLPKLLAATNAKQFADVGAGLQFTKRCVLMYLCGFLRRMVKAETATKMTVEDLAAVFAPLIVRCSDEAKMDDAVQATQRMLVALIGDWTLKPVWPVPPSAIVKKSP